MLTLGSPKSIFFTTGYRFIMGITTARVDFADGRVDFADGVLKLCGPVTFTFLSQACLNLNLLHVEKAQVW